MRNPDFYRSLDIIDFHRSPESEGRQLARLLEKQAHRYLLLEAQEFKSFEALMGGLSGVVAIRNKDSSSNGEPLYAPELHISCHGCGDGILWRDGSLISWRQLRFALRRYSATVGLVWGPQQNGALMQTTSLLSLGLSCCYGSQAAKEFFRSEPYPVGGFMAPNRSIYDADCADFFLRLYELQEKEDPWNVPEKVSRLMMEKPLFGPEGTVQMECFHPNFSPNASWSASSAEHNE